MKNAVEIPNLKDSDVLRFWSKVGIDLDLDKCWDWRGSFRRKYGRFNVTVSKGKDKDFSSHRIAYYISNGIDPADKIVMHKCDNPKCVNPNHLSLGTNKDNTNDMMNKGRGKKQFKNGENHKGSKLTKEDVLFIRENLDTPNNILAYKYKVDASLISRIKNNKLWKHI